MLFAQNKVSIILSISLLDYNQDVLWNTKKEILLVRQSQSKYANESDILFEKFTDKFFSNSQHVAIFVNGEEVLSNITYDPRWYETDENLFLPKGSVSMFFEAGKISTQRKV